MRCPNYIRKALIKRAKCAATFTDLDLEISEWLEKNDLLNLIEDYDIHGGCESYVNPYDSSFRILKVIENV